MEGGEGGQLDGTAKDQRRWGGTRKRDGAEEKKTEGRPPSGLIKSITSSLEVARVILLLFLLLALLLLLLILVPFASRRIRVTVLFFPFAAPRLTTIRAPVPSRSAPPQSFIYAYFDPSTCRPALVGNRFFLCPLPSLSIPSPSLLRPLSLSFSTSSLNNC